MKDANLGDNLAKFRQWQDVSTSRWVCSPESDGIFLYSSHKLIYLAGHIYISRFVQVHTSPYINWQKKHLWLRLWRYCCIIYDFVHYQMWSHFHLIVSFWPWTLGLRLGVSLIMMQLIREHCDGCTGCPLDYTDNLTKTQAAGPTYEDLLLLNHFNWEGSPLNPDLFRLQYPP